MTVAGITSTNNACGVTSTGYSDYTATIGEMTAGLSCDVIINDPTTTTSFSFGAIPYIVTGAVFIDFNQNGSLEDPDESFPLITGTDAAGDPFLIGTFTVPPTALPGPTRLRVRFSVSTALIPAPNELIIDPCSDLVNGETEDYTLVIINPIPSINPSCVDTATFLPKNNATDVCTHLTELSWVDTGSTAVVPVTYLVNVHEASNDELVFTEASDDSIAVITSTLKPNTQYYWVVTPESALTSASGCDTLYFTTAANENPEVDILSVGGLSNDTIAACLNQDLSLIGASKFGNGTITYNWTTSEVIAPNNADSVVFNSDSLGAIEVRVRVTDDLGCYSEDVVIADVKESPKNLVIKNASDTVPCVDGEIEYYLFGDFELVLAGYHDTSGVFQTLTVTQNNDSSYFFGAIPYPIDVEISFYTGDCFETLTKTILSMEPFIDKPTVNWPVGGFCEGNIYIATVTNSTTFATTVWSNGQVGDTLKASVSGDYYATFENDCGIQYSDTFQFDFKTTPTVQAINTPEGVVVCSNDSIELNVSSADSVVWQVTPNVSGNNYFVKSAGDYYAVIHNGSCFSNTDTVTVSQKVAPSKPVITANTASPYCQGDNVVLTTSSTDDLMWSSGETTTDITLTGNSLVTVTATNLDGCSATSNEYEVVFGGDFTGITVTVDGLTTGCDTNSTVLSVATTDAAVWYPGTIVSNAITVISSGEYYAVVTDSLGCTFTTDSISIGFDAIPNQPIINVVADSLTTPLVVGASYVWSDENGVVAATSIPSYKPLISGEFTVTVVTENGCSSAASEATMFTSVGNIELLESNISLFPNPNSGEFKILNDTPVVLDAVIINFQGKIMDRLVLVPGVNSIQSELSVGIYFISAQGVHLKLIVNQ